MSTTTDSEEDHLPSATPAVMERSAAKRPAGAAGPGSYRWGDRALFAAAGLLLGFAGAYVYLEKAPATPMASLDPHAGLSGVGPGASRDIPGSGGGAPAISQAAQTAKAQLQNLQEQVEATPDDPDLLIRLGNTAYDAEEFKIAIDAYEKALKKRPNDVNVLTDTGVSYRNLGDSDRALTFFDRALKVDPKHWPARFNQAIVLGLDKGDVPRAKEVLAVLKKEHPEIPSLDKLGQALEERAKGSK